MFIRMRLRSYRVGTGDCACVYVCVCVCMHTVHSTLATPPKVLFLLHRRRRYTAIEGTLSCGVLMYLNCLVNCVQTHARTTRARPHARSSPPPSSMNNSASVSFHPPSLLLLSTPRPPLAPVFKGLILTPRSFFVLVAHTISWSREGKMLRCVAAFIATLMLVRVRAMGVCERGRVRVCAGNGVRERAATRSRCLAPDTPRDT
jgi:hypothetical protein